MQWQRAMSRSTPAPWPASAGRRRSPRWKSTRFRTFLLLYASNFFSTTKVGHERNSVAGFLATLALYAWALGLRYLLRLLLRYGQMASFLPFLWSGNVNNCQELLVVRWVPNVNSGHFLLMLCYHGHRTTALLRATTTNLCALDSLPMNLREISLMPISAFLSISASFWSIIAGGNLT